MSNATIQAIAIKLDAEYPQDTSIGLYTSGGVSYLRWSEAILSGVAESWASDIILQNGIGEIEEAGSLERGGNVAEYQGTIVKVADAGDLMLALKDLGIGLTGLPATITRFIGTVADSDSVSRTVIFTGIVEDQSWNDTELNISLKNSRYKRNTSLTTTDENNVTVPVTFGKLYPPDSETKINNLAKFVRTEDTQDEKLYTNEYFTGANPEINIFPIVTIPSPRGGIDYGFKTYGNITLVSGAVTDTYVIVKSGTGSSQIRQINSFAIPVSPSDITTFSVKNVFETELSATNDDTRSWVQFVKISRNYNADLWPCKSFLASSDGSEVTKPELYGEADDKLSRIADCGLTVKDTNKNSLEIDGEQYSDNIDNLESSIILPITSLALVDSADLGDWNLGGTFDGHTWVKKVNGIYGNDDWTGKIVASGSLINATNAYDKNSTTYAEYSIDFDVSSMSTLKLIKMLKFGLPALPKNADIDKFYLGIKMNSASDDAAYFPGSPAVGSILATFRRFAYSLSTNNVFASQYMASVEGGSNNEIANIPDIYFTDIVSTNSLAFYLDHPAATPPYYLNGYKLFEIVGCTKEIYNVFLEGGLIFVRSAGSIGYHSDSTKIYEIAIIFKLSDIDIKDKIYSPHSGRIFNDTWSSRKTAANLMESPVDILEHLARLKNWSETGETGIDWGKEYATSALIKTGVAEGSFDSANLAGLATQTCAFQVLDGEKAKIDILEKKLCDTFGVCRYINSDGYECIETLDPISPAESITLSDIIGVVGDVVEPKTQNIFCEPVVNYQYNAATQEFDKSLRVTNITENAWQSSYTPGFTDADGETVWNSLKAIYSKYRMIETCPQEFSDQFPLATYTAALAYLQRKIAWMEKRRLSFKVGYAKGMDYHVFKHVMVQLPHHTNNISVECIIEKISKNKNGNTVSLDVVVLDSIIESWKDTTDTGTEYQDTADTGDEKLDI